MQPVTKIYDIAIFEATNTSATEVRQLNCSVKQSKILTDEDNHFLDYLHRMFFKIFVKT